MKERRKKEIIVERYEAKLKEEAEMLAYQAQRASESRQRSQGQRSKTTRGAGVCYSPAFYHQLSLPTASQPLQSSSRRSNPSASRRAADEEGPAPSRGNVGSGRQRRPQDYDEESEQGRGVRRPNVSAGGRRPTVSEDEEEQQAVYSRRPLSSTASKSRIGIVVGDEPADVDEEYDVQPVSRRGGNGGRGSSVEYQPSGVGASSSSSRSRRVQA